MPRRNTKKLMTQKENQRVELKQLSPKDILRSEAVYRKDLNDFVTGLMVAEKFKKNTIKKLARDLEEAGTVELHLISARITNDIKEMAEQKNLEKPIIAPEYVRMVLEDKYKNPKKKNKSTDAKKSSHPEQNAITTTSSITTHSEEPEPSQFTTEEPKPSPQSVKDEIDFDSWVDDLYHLSRSLAEKLTGYSEDKLLKINDNFKLVSETKKYRFEISKRLPDLDLKTIYSDVRTDILLLNDFIKQLENELDSRKKKQNLLST